MANNRNQLKFKQKHKRLKESSISKTWGRWRAAGGRVSEVDSSRGRRCPKFHTRSAGLGCSRLASPHASTVAVQDFSLVPFPPSDSKVHSPKNEHLRPDWAHAAGSLLGSGGESKWPRVSPRLTGSGRFPQTWKPLLYFPPNKTHRMASKNTECLTVPAI